MSQVFISYSRRDLSFVDCLVQDLKRVDLDVWYDMSGLEGGERWGEKIQSAIRECECVIVVLSPDSIKSQWVEREFLFASNLKKKIIPLMYRECEVPFNYLDLNYIDVQGERYSQNFSKILKSLDRTSYPPVAGGKNAAQMTSEYSKIKPAASSPVPKRKTGIVIAIIGAVVVFAACAMTLAWLFGSPLMKGFLPVSISFAGTGTSAPALFPTMGPEGNPGSVVELSTQTAISPMAINPTPTAVLTLAPEIAVTVPFVGNLSSSERSSFLVVLRYLPAVPSGDIDKLKGRLEQLGYKVETDAIIPEPSLYYPQENLLQYGHPDCLVAIGDIWTTITDIVNLSSLNAERFSSNDTSYQSKVVVIYFANSVLFIP